uniref:Uncharacterized protein n=1 Tax=Aegilops tauschii subsp. strangulata TaxID=200361 RepID=A0A453PUE0_AEGTS
PHPPKKSEPPSRARQLGFLAAATAAGPPPRGAPSRPNPPLPRHRYRIPAAPPSVKQPLPPAAPPSLEQALLPSNAAARSYAGDQSVGRASTLSIGGAWNCFGIHSRANTKQHRLHLHSLGQDKLQRLQQPQIHMQVHIPVTPLHISKELPKPRHTSKELPNPRHTSKEPPNPRHTSKEPPNPRHTSKEPPNLRHTSKEPPNLRHTSKEPPKPRHISKEPPKLEHISKEPPKLEHISKEPPKLEHINKGHTVTQQPMILPPLTSCMLMRMLAILAIQLQAMHNPAILARTLHLSSTQ